MNITQKEREDKILYKDYDEAKILYVDGLLKAVKFHRETIKRLEEKLLELQVYLDQGMSHGKTFEKDNIPQKHYRGEFYEQRLIETLDKKHAIEDSIEAEKKTIEEIEAWVDTLELEEQDLINQRYYQGKNYSEISILEGTAKNTIKNRIYSILKKYPDNPAIL